MPSRFAILASMLERPEKLLSLREVARLLGLSAAWVREETTAGRLPHLKAGRRRLYSLEAVVRALLNRAGARGEFDDAER